MAHQYTTDQIEGMTAGTVTIQGHNGESIGAYVAKPDGDGPLPGVVLIHHIPGWDELYREFTRKFAHHGYAAISPNLYHRNGHGVPEDVAAKVRAEGGAPDSQVVGDVVGARDWLKAQSYSNGKVGVIGSCSGGRHTVLVASRSTGWDAAVDLWGGRVVMPTEDLFQVPRQWGESALKRGSCAPRCVGRCRAWSPSQAPRCRRLRGASTELLLAGFKTCLAGLAFLW